MKHILILAAVALGACTSTNVMQLGEGRWRATAEAGYTASSAEAAALGAATNHCASIGRRMEAEVARSQTNVRHIWTGQAMVPASWGEGAVNFTCVAR